MLFDKHIAWIDIETTGLYGKGDMFTYGERDHLILEIALIITDAELNTRHVSTYVVEHDLSKIHSVMNEHVKDMHKTSGLLVDLANRTLTKSLYRVETELVTSINHYCPEKPILGGSSIHFDRFFISSQMPRLNSSLHYRNFDASTLKMFHDMVSDKPLQHGREEPKHRALDDIEFSIQLTQMIKDKLKDKGALCYLKNLLK